MNTLQCYIQGVKFLNNNLDQQDSCNGNMYVNEEVKYLNGMMLGSLAVGYTD